MKDLIKELKKENNLMIKILEKLVDFICIKDGEGKWIKVNAFTSKKDILQLDGINCLGKTDEELVKIHPNLTWFFENSRQSDERTWVIADITKVEERIYNHKGEFKIFEVIKVPFFHQDGKRKELLVLGNDVTFNKNNEIKLDLKIRELEDFKFALDESSIVAITDSRGMITYVNNKFCEISKYSKEELVGKTHRVINSGYHPKPFFEDMWRTIQNGDVWKGNMKNKAKDGTFYWVKSTIIPFLDNKGNPYQYMAIRQDITEQKKFEEQILHNAYHDELTGLRNRRYFNSELTEWIDDNKENNKKMALLYLDINRFKYINDTLGHSIGDQVLKSVSKRLTNHLQEIVELYRFGGDEFIIVLKNCCLEEIEEVTNKINRLIKNPFHHGNESLYLSASIGISFYPNDGYDLETLLKKADSAMHVAKNSGKQGVQYYSSAVYEKMAKTMELERELRKAVEGMDFILLYQPQVDLSVNKITGVEALIRWEHATLGNIPPSDFIPLAEETGLITSISEWVLETACRQNKKWQESGCSPIRVGVNISPYLFGEELIDMVTRILRKTKLQPCYLDLEITESFMQDPEFAISILKKLKSLGVRLSIDDFGTGYSSLSYLRHLPIDCLKIDRSFITEMQEDNGVIVKTIIDMAAHLKVGVIAEGVETSEQLQFLTNLNCTEGQGYFFSRPLPDREITSLLTEEERK
jgi:diguanylate cyclase (GGDEF)-like protein/PAS domain S-box-containing protein